MRLPDWANYCERCGARVQDDYRPEHADPIEQVGLDDTSSMEPLWPEAVVAQDEGVAGPEPFEAVVEEKPLEPRGGKTRAAHLVNVVDDEPEPSDVPEEPLTGATQLLQDLDDRSEDEGSVSVDMPTELMDASEVAMEDVVQEQEPEGDELEPEEDADSDGVDESEYEEDEPSASAGEEPDELDEDADSDEPVESDGAQEADAESVADDEATDYPDDEATVTYEDQLPVIDFADQGSPHGMDSPIGHHVDVGWQDNRRTSQHAMGESSIPMPLVVAIAGAAILLSFMIASFVLGGADNAVDEADPTTHVAETRHVSKREASRVIADLDGWWKTGRTLDNRYWHIQGGLMETYAADGMLAGQKLVDPDSVEQMDEGPGGIEGEGYYLRSIAYYLCDDDPDTLHAVNQDGSADEAANLMRTDPPSFAEGGAKTEKKKEEPAEEEKEEEAKDGDYLLPESDTRVYDISELEGMSDHDLFVARNEIYARHGYVFEVGELSEYFSTKSWYHPSDVFNEGDITEVERQNVSTILALEQSRGSQYI